MRIVRSWPRVVPPNRSYVVDLVPILRMDNCDYHQIFADADDDYLLLEWDIAVSKEDVNLFAALALDDPRRVMVAPYRIYYEHMLDAPVWAHRTWDGEPRGMANPVGAKPVQTMRRTCNLFGLGMVYLPRKLMNACARSGYSASIGDVQFSMWHYANVSEDVPIAWDVRPVHLNYTLEGIAHE